MAGLELRGGLTHETRRRCGRIAAMMLVAVTVSSGGCNAEDPVAPRSMIAGGVAASPRVDVAFPMSVLKSKVAVGRLAFAGVNGIYTMKPDGSDIALLAEGHDPSWSPDGSRIAFWRSDRINGGIFVMNADGSNVTRIVADGYQPTWSPDGERIAFGCGGICVINVNGTGRIKLTAHDLPSLSYDVCVRDSDPAWSPNG